MPDDRDRALAQLAVQEGFLSQDEAAHYWHRLQDPNSPRLVHLLVQEGRLSKADLDHLRNRFMQGSGSGSGQGPLPASPPGEIVEDWESSLQKDTLLARVLMERGQATQDQLRECRQIQLHHRMRLGVVLVRKGYVDRAAVEGAIATVRYQINGAPQPAAQASPSGPTAQYDRFKPPPAQETGRVRRGSGGVPIVAVDSAEDARAAAPRPLLGELAQQMKLEPLHNPFASVREKASPLARPSEAPTIIDGEVISPQNATIIEDMAPMQLPGYRGTPTVLDRGIQPIPLIEDSGDKIVLRGPRGVGPQDEVPTILNRPAVNPLESVMGNPELSVDELNPFAMPPTAAAGSVEELNPFGGGMPGAPQGVPSVDELNAFEDIPLPPPPSPGATSPPRKAASGPDINAPPDDAGEHVAASKLRTLTPAGVPIGGAIDSDSAREKASARIRRTTVRKKKSGSPLLIILLLVGGIALAAAAVAIYTLVGF